MQKIGNVNIDDSLYSGTDLYSDGSVEDEMLDIAKKYAELQYNDLIAERKSWPLLYHFSHIRENIVSWLPIEKKHKVLEIGAGCGAITGALCRMAMSVDAVELSMKRTMINAHRHKDAQNLAIRVGNFQDIEKTLPSDYDFITLIGVLEYASGYIKSESPHVEFLNEIKKHLAPSGKIIIAIENKFGLKYWAGCREDHTGNFFQGLEGYRGVDNVRTFGKNELTQIAKTAGFSASQIEFYYPYPDYKFPEQIFSDERLPTKEDLTFNSRNFDRDRLSLFNEPAVFGELLKEGMFPFFSNSFIMILGRGGK